MNLRGQHGQTGYAMAALLVSLAVMSVLMTAVLPAWRHQAKREKETELIFRGEQYVRAIRLWEMKMGPGSRPPTFDILVQQKFLRKKYKDPMTTDGEFQPLFVGANPQPAGPGGRQSGPGGRQTGPGVLPQAQAPTPPSSVGSQLGRGGILGVVSKSKEASIRIYRGGSHYNEWQFIFANAANTPGGRGGQQMPGGRGGQQMPGAPPGRGIGPGGRGIGPGGPGGRGIGPGRGGFDPGNPPVIPGAGRGRGGF
jgi:type II secretory pathway pseudopilin PulG